jgi:hypothetical protein
MSNRLGGLSGPLVGGVILVASAVVVGLTALLAPSDRAAWSAAAAAAITASVIGWQSWETRQATAAARSALAESEKRRLDERGPRFWLVVGVVEGPITPAADPGGEASLAREALLESGQLIGLRCRGSIENEGAQTLRVHFRDVRVRTAPDLWSAPPLPGRPTHEIRDLRPGQTLECLVELFLPFETWVDRASASGTSRALAAWIDVFDPYDNGITDALTISLHARSAVTLSQDESSHLNEDPAITCDVKRDRLYWRARRQKIPL